MEQRDGISYFDNLELLHCQSSSHEFPIHYHNTYCLSIIHDGVMGENDICAPAESLLISHPFEVHENRLINQTSYSFTTFYISPDLFMAATALKQFFFKDKVVYEPSLIRSFSQLAKDMVLLENNKRAIPIYGKKLTDTLRQLAYTFSSNGSYTETVLPEKIKEIKDYISHHLDNRISLTDLAKIAGMDKFKFLRWFRTHTGLTPFNYIVLTRIETGKQFIRQGKPIIHAALDSGFYDQSHFTNYFKHFVGITPKEYQRRFNIFQDMKDGIS